MISVTYGTAGLSFLDQSIEALGDHREIPVGHIFLSFEMMAILELPTTFEVYRPNLTSK